MSRQYYTTYHAAYTHLGSTVAYLGWRDGEYALLETGSRIFIITGTEAVTTAWSGGVVYTSTVSRDDLQPALSLAAGENGQLRMVWNEIPGWTWTDAEGGGEYERLAGSANIYYSMLSDGVWQEPLRINDHPGLGDRSDGAHLDTVLVSDTLHVAWSGLHYVDAILDQETNTNIYVDAIPQTPITPTVAKHYALPGNASAMRVGPKGESGDLYYLHGDHRGSLSLVTDVSGNAIGRVWYDPFGEIISYTLPLTFTDRLFAGGQRESTIDLYQLGAEWYDPYTARYLVPDPSISIAPPGPNPYVAAYLGAPGRPSGRSGPGDYPSIVANKLAGEFVGRLGLGWRLSRSMGWQASRHWGYLYLEASSKTLRDKGYSQFFTDLGYAAGDRRLFVSSLVEQLGGEYYRTLDGDVMSLEHLRRGTTARWMRVLGFSAEVDELAQASWVKTLRWGVDEVFLPFGLDAVWQLAMDAGTPMPIGERAGRAAIAGTVGTVVGGITSFATVKVCTALGIASGPAGWIALGVAVVVGITFEARLTNWLIEQAY